MVVYRSILVPTDGSQFSVRAAEHAVKMAKVMKSKIIALHILDARPLALYAGSEKDVFKRNMEARGREHLKKVVEMAKGVEVEEVLKEGLPADEIGRIARDRGVDLIVIGTRGLTAARRLLLGSTAEEVVKWSPCPVMVVK